jgi:3-oxoadipate enol-lactonase
MAVDDASVPAVASARTDARRAGLLRVEGAHLHYEVCGQGPAIAFAHGLGGSQMSWWQQVSHFARTHTCITFAHRGFAPSAVDAGAPDPARYADDLRCLLDHLGIERAHLLGQSMGGWTVVEFCLRHPQRVASLVLSATTGSIDHARIPGADRGALAEWRARSTQAAAQCRAAAVHPAAGPRMAREQPALHLLYQHIDELSRGLDKEAVRSRLQAMRVRAPEGLAATGVALLLVSPQEDIVIPPPALQALAGAVPGARLVQLPETGHSPYFERAETFNRCLDDFFRDVERDPRHATVGARTDTASSPPRSAP